MSWAGIAVHALMATHSIIIIISVLTRMSAQVGLVGVRHVKIPLVAIDVSVQMATNLTIFFKFVFRYVEGKIQLIDLTFKML